MKAKQHEWIPCNKILDTVKRDVDAAKKAKDVKEETKEWVGWLDLQNQLRTPTVDIIFKPTISKSDLGKELGEYMRGETTVVGPEASGPEVSGQDTEKAKEPRTIEGYARQLRATRFGLCGHSGALYVTQEGKAKPQTTGQGGFHDKLRAAFKDNMTPNAYIEALKKVVRTELWDGTIDFLPPELTVEHQKVIAMGYTGADAKTATDTDLYAFGARIRAGQIVLRDLLTAANVTP